MEIESENDPPYPPPSYSHHHERPLPTPPAHTLSLDELRTLKKKQEKNILNKI